jgi:hypothetical protein
VCNLPSRKQYQKYSSKKQLKPVYREKYKNARYKLRFYLDLTRRIPIYTHLQIETWLEDNPDLQSKIITIENRNIKKTERLNTDYVINDQIKTLTDVKNFGVFLFLLASKYKYDLIKKNPLSPDHAGFLHSAEISRINPIDQRIDDEVIHVGKFVYKTLGKLYSPDKNQNKNIIEGFINSFLYDPEQLYHLIRHLGKIDENQIEQYYWWLNVPYQNIIWVNSITGEQISDDALRIKLKNIFIRNSHRILLNKREIKKALKQSNRIIKQEKAIQPKTTGDLYEVQRTPVVHQRNEDIFLQDKIIKIDPKNTHQNLFRFEYRWTPFVGRDDMMKRLYEFVNCKDKNLLWWSITGKGGTGKSRMALELCCELREQGWYASFLGNTNRMEVWK